MPHTEHVPIATTRKNLADVANKSLYQGQVTVMTRKGKRVAAVVPIELLPDEVRSQIEEGGDEAT